MLTRFLNHRKIGQKLILMAILTALINIVSTGYIISNIVRVRQGEAILYNHNMPLRGAEHNSWITLRTLDDDAARLVLSKNESSAQAALPKFKDDIQKLQTYLDQVHMYANTPEEIRLANLYLDASRGPNGFISKDQHAVDLRLAGHSAEAAQMALQVSTLEAEKWVDQSVNYDNVEIKAIVDESNGLISNGITIGTFLLITAAAIAISLAILLARQIGKAVSLTADALEMIVKNDLSIFQKIGGTLAG